MRKPIIGVMGPGNSATAQDIENAYKLGQLIAQRGWILLSGGRNKGVMDAVNKGAKSKDGLTVGIIPTKDNNDTSEFVDIAVVTGMASARNNINVLTSNVVIACGMEAGTASEVALALKADKYVILLIDNAEGNVFFKSLRPSSVFIVSTPEEAIEQVEKLI